MRSASHLLKCSIAALATLTIFASAAPASEWMNHGPSENCDQKTVQITNQIGHDFFQDYCLNSICVGTKGGSYLNATTFTGGCAQKDVYCANIYDSMWNNVSTTDHDYTVSYPKGRLLCSVPPSVKSQYVCGNGASTVVDSVSIGVTSFNAFSQKNAVVSGYFKSWKDAKGCARTATYGESKKTEDVFYPACDKKAGEIMCS